jgi:hypothetical protein
MKTAIRTVALAGLVGLGVLAGDVSTAKADPYWGRPGYRHFYPGYRAYAYPYAYGYSGYDYYPGYYTGYYPGYYAYSSPGVYVGGGYGGGRYGHGHWGRGYYWGRGHWRR